MVINCVIYTFTTSNWIHQAYTIHPRRRQRGRSWSDSKQCKNTKVQINVVQRKQIDKGKTRNCAFLYAPKKVELPLGAEGRLTVQPMPYILLYGPSCTCCRKKCIKIHSKQVLNLWWGAKGLRLRNFLPTFSNEFFHLFVCIHLPLALFVCTAVIRQCESVCVLLLNFSCSLLVSLALFKID